MQDLSKDFLSYSDLIICLSRIYVQTTYIHYESRNNLYSCYILVYWYYDWGINNRTLYLLQCSHKVRPFFLISHNRDLCSKMEKNSSNGSTKKRSFRSKHDYCWQSRRNLLFHWFPVEQEQRPVPRHNINNELIYSTDVKQNSDAMTIKILPTFFFIVMNNTHNMFLGRSNCCWAPWFYQTIQYGYLLR